MATTDRAEADRRFFAQAGRRSWLSVCVVAGVSLLAWWWLAPALTLGLRNDDFLIPYYLDSETGAVRWPRVFEELFRGWFGAPELYRPMVSLSLALEYSWTGLLPSLHLGNVLMVTVAAAATASLAMRLVASDVTGSAGAARTAAAGLVAGAMVVLHPAAIEPATWILSRTTALQMAFTALALASYVRALDGGARWPHLLLLALALGSKEGAVTAPFSMLLLDLLHRRGVPLGARARAALPAFAVLGAYLALRLVLLGQIGKSGDPVDLATRADNLLIRAGDLFASPAPGGERPWWMFAVWATVACGLARSAGRRALLLLPWSALLLAPASHVEVIADRLDGRLLFDAVPFVALAAGLAAARCRRSAPQAAGALAAVAAVLLPAAASLGWQQGYVEESRADRSLRRQLAAAAEGSSGGAPLAVTGLPVLPLYHFKLWGMLGQQPHQQQDLHVVGLPDLLFAPLDQPSQLGDATAVHALLAAGGRLATWQPEAGRFVEVAPAREGSCELARQGPVYAPTSPWPGTSVAAVQVRLPAGSDVAAVRLKLAVDLPDGRAMPWLERPVVDGVAWFDTTRAFAPILFETVGAPFAGLLVEADSGPLPDAAAVVVHGTSRKVALPAPLSGERVSVDALPERLRAPGSLQYDRRLHLLLPTGVRSAAGFDDVLAEELRYAWELAAPLDVQWFWTGRERPGARPCVTPLDWARVR